MILNKKSNLFFLLTLSVFVLGCVTQSKTTSKLITKAKTNVTFSENSDIIPLEDRNRRKFDNAVIADLDQDGFLDLLLTEHSRRVELYWNNNGVFELGKPFIFGDTHGIAVSDYDFDGKVDVIVQPGGGDGKNPRKPRYYHVNKDRTIEKGGEFKHFEKGRGRAAKFVDIKKDGKLDLVTSAFPTLKALNKGNILYTNDNKSTFKFNSYISNADRMGMRTTLLDFNNDGITDILFHGGRKLVLVEGLIDGYKEVTKQVLGDLSKTNLVNSVSQIDFDNDGDFDLFLTRSKHPFDAESDYDAVNKRFYFFARRTKFDYNNIKVKGDLKIENLQMAFPNFDVFLGANKKLWKRKNDKHGHHDLTITKEEAKGYPEDTKKKALYIGYLGNGMWRIGGHTNSPTSAVLHNVMTSPEIIKLKDLPAKLLENKEGKFIEVTKNFGIDIAEQTSSSAIGDFNNDGWSDIFVLRYGESSKSTKQILYLNHEGKTFKRDENHGVITKELGATGMGADAFDYDNDGDLDIICSNERGKWHLFTNNFTSSSNKYVTVKVGNSPTGKATATSAVLTIKSCGKIYKRVVGETSSSFSHSFNTYLNVGLGTCNKIEFAEVVWTNGEKKKLEISTLNKIYTVGKFN
ncbi:VCBS repeat-containing protein [Polaribacter sp. Z022]|uniref:FG-GAP repeat domain-containing protein n=1 Tax=Polaribacter sp. Z022 TaxID=2927125 RepID=UPI0020204D36|nr:VCBS repeat-containing protein [Polaribacter sp. Z022]MCL7752658.1 VCBS repeat-containing protein [Polaribacter sp. Z022]